MPISNNISFCVNYNIEKSRGEIDEMFHKLKEHFCNDTNFKNIILYTNKKNQTYFKINLYNLLNNNDVFMKWVQIIRDTIDIENKLKIYYNYGVFNIKENIKSPNIYVAEPTHTQKIYNVIFIDDD